MSVTKEALVSRLSEEAGISKVAAAKVLNELREVVKEELVAKSVDFTLPGILTLKPTFRAARPGRNPQTGAAIQIAAKRSAKVLLDKGLRDLMV